MNAPEEDLANSDPKANIEITNGLDNAHTIKNEPKKKHGKSRNDPEYLNPTSTELTEKDKELGLLQRELENANSRIKELEGMEKELEALRKDRENDTTSLKGYAADKQKTKESFKEYSHPGIASFLLQLYPPREGHYPGKVKHFPFQEGEKQDEQRINGIDDKDFAAFINKYLPKLEESFVVHEPIAPVPSKSEVETRINVFKMASILKFGIVLEGKFIKEKLIPSDQIFQLSLVIDPLESVVEKNLPCPYNISVYAKRMDGGLKQILGKSDGQILEVGEFTANVHCFPLITGIYRIIAFGTINIKDDLKNSVIGFHESSIFRVT
jgi:hypothetical protein